MGWGRGCCQSPSEFFYFSQCAPKKSLHFLHKLLLHGHGLHPGHLNHFSPENPAAGQAGRAGRFLLLLQKSHHALPGRGGGRGRQDSDGGSRRVRFTHLWESWRKTGRDEMRLWGVGAEVMEGERKCGCWEMRVEVPRACCSSSHFARLRATDMELNFTEPVALTRSKCSTQLQASGRFLNRFHHSMADAVTSGWPIQDYNMTFTSVPRCHTQLCLFLSPTSLVGETDTPATINRLNSLHKMLFRINIS